MHLFLIKIQQLKFQVRLLVTGTWHSFATAALAHDVKTKTKEAKKSDADEGFEPARQKFARLCIYFEKPPSSVVRTTAKRWTHPLVSTWIEDSVVDDTRPELQSERRVNQIWLDRIPDSSKKTERVFMIPEERREMSLDHVFAFRAYHTCSTCTYD